MQVRELNHIGELGQVSIGVNVLQRKDLVRVVVEVDDFLNGLFRTFSAVGDDGLLILVLRNSHVSLVALLAIKLSRHPGALGVLDVNEGVFLLRHGESKMWVRGKMTGLPLPEPKSKSHLATPNSDWSFSMCTWE